MSDFQTILGIETSCDETSVAILERKNNRTQLLSNIIGSSAQLQEKYGGIIPEQAAREQLKLMVPTVLEALEKANKSPEDIGKIAVTYGPGLIGSLLIGVETAKILAVVWKKPLIRINHLMGHFYANWIATDLPDFKEPTFPCLGLLVSGGHTDLVLFKNHFEYEYLGGTRDDAAGECFDKCARLIGYPYPGGPKISKIAEKGNQNAYMLPRPMSDSGDFDFSFSGLKTAFANLVEEHFKVSKINDETAQVHWNHIVLENSPAKDEQKLADFCASLEQAIIDSLINKVVVSGKKYNIEQLIIAGGVAANKKLVSQLKEKFNGTVLVPPPILCTDNGAMIASAGFFSKDETDPLALQANPNLSLEH